MQMHITVFPFRASLSSVEYRDVLTRQGTFTELFVTGYGYSNRTGDPKLPVYHRLIEIPLNAGFEISVRNTQVREVDLSAENITNKIIPAQEPVSKHITDPNEIPFRFNSQTYLRNEYLGGPLITVTPIGMMRGVRIARLDIDPVWYNPVTNKLEVYFDFEAIITFKGGDVQATIELKKKYQSSGFENLFRAFPNHQSLP